MTDPAPLPTGVPGPTDFQPSVTVLVREFLAQMTDDDGQWSAACPRPADQGEAVNLIDLLAPRVKAAVGGVVSGVVTYAAAATVAGSVLTLHGLEVAAASAVLTALGVHQAPKNKPKHPPRKANAA